MKHNLWSKAAGLALTASLLLSSLSVTGFADGETEYDMEYYSQLAGKDVTINITTFYQEGGNKEFDEGFKKWLNADKTNLTNNGGDDIVSAVSAMGYDSYFVALEAAKAAKSTDPAKIMEALWGVEYKGVTGDIKFDSVNGDADRKVAYIKAADTTTGAWVFVKEQGV